MQLIATVSALRLGLGSVGAFSSVSSDCHQSVSKAVDVTSEKDEDGSSTSSFRPWLSPQEEGEGWLE